MTQIVEVDRLERSYFISLEWCTAFSVAKVYITKILIILTQGCDFVIKVWREVNQPTMFKYA